MSDQEEQAPSVSAEELDDYREWKSFRETEKASKPSAAMTTAERFGLPTEVVIEINGADRTYAMVDLSKEVLTYFHVLVMFSDSSADRAMSMFQALLVPDDFDRLMKDMRPMLHEINKAHTADGNAPSVTDVWIGMADAVSAPLKAVMDDPKLQDWLAGRSVTGQLSEPVSPVTALPRTGVPSASSLPIVKNG